MATLYNQYIYKNGAWMKIGTSSDSVTYTLSYSALTGLLTLTGSDGSTSTVTIKSGSSDAITGITVNGTTVTVTDGVAAISVPTTLSAFTNDVGYITSYTETDPVFRASAAAGITATDISNWNAKSSTDENVLQTPVNDNSTYGLTLSTNTWQAATDSVYTTDYVSFALDTTNGIGQLRFRNSDDSAYTWIQNRVLGFVDKNNQLEYIYTLPNKSGTVAMTSDIDGKWNGVSFKKSSQLTNQTIYIPYLSTVSATEAKLVQVIEGSSITGHAIPKYDTNGYLYSTTPTATDNTKKVATTAFIQTALQNLGISYESTELTSGTVAAYADALGDREHKVVLGMSGQSVTDLPNDSTCTIEIYKFDANSVLCRATILDGTEFIRTKRSGTWGSWHKMKNDVPDIVQFYIGKSSYSHSGYANLQITNRTNISGDTSFTSANTDYWNIQLDPGIYRMNLYCFFQSSSAVTTDVGIGLGNNANRRATQIEARVQTTGSLTKLNASGILKVTSYNDLYSFLIYMGDTTARDINGYWTIERIGQ